jgi:hypothetical protein
MAASTNNIRKTITDLKDPHQIMELNRQLEWLWRQLLGNVSMKSISKNGVAELSERSADYIKRQIESGTSSDFLNKLAAFINATVAGHQFEASALISMLSLLFSITLNNGKVSISNFVASYDNIRDAASNITVSSSMLDQSVWTEVQRMIDASTNGGA